MIPAGNSSSSNNTTLQYTHTHRVTANEHATHAHARNSNAKFAHISASVRVSMASADIATYYQHTARTPQKQHTRHGSGATRRRPHVTAPFRSRFYHQQTTERARATRCRVPKSNNSARLCKYVHVSFSAAANDDVNQVHQVRVRFAAARTRGANILILL